MSKLDEDELKQFFKFRQTKLGFIVNFMNAYDKNLYFQSTIRKRPFTIIPPKKIFVDGIEKHLDKFERMYFDFRPSFISCETRTYVITSPRSVDLVMSCEGNLYRSRRLSIRLPITSLKRFAMDMATVFQNAEMPLVICGSAKDEFERFGWSPKISFKVRLRPLKPWRRFPVTIVMPDVEKLDELNLFGLNDIALSKLRNL